MQFEISELAEFELDDAFQYYQQQEQGLGDRFIIEFSSAVDRIRCTSSDLIGQLPVIFGAAVSLDLS